MRILIISTQYPGWGGSATNSYSLIKKMRSDGFRCAGVFLDAKTNVDPERIGGIFSNINSRELIRYLGGYPTHVFGKNYKAPCVGVKKFPRAKNIYLVSGCPHMMEASRSGLSAIDYIKSGKKAKFAAEERAIKFVDFVIPNSMLGKKLLEFNYGKLKKITKPINTSNTAKELSQVEWSNKKYDICFCSSHFSRPVKNVKLAKRILASTYLSKFKILIIGKDSSSFLSGKNITNIDLVTHLEAKKLIGQSKVIINTSFYDASPNVIREGIALGSNVLVSENCGWAEKYPKLMVVNDYRNISEWLKKINFLTVKKIKNNYSEKFKSQDLLNILK